MTDRNERRHIDIDDASQVNHFIRCWGGSRADIEKAIQATGTTEISKIYVHLFGIPIRSRAGFDF